MQGERGSFLCTPWLKSVIFYKTWTGGRKKSGMNVVLIVCTIMYTVAMTKQPDFVKKNLASLFGISNIVPELKLSAPCTISKRWQKTFKTFVKAIK